MNTMNTKANNMNSEHQYKLEKGSRKHRCPDCDKKRFVRYVDTHTGEYLPEQYGRCDRESNCGYFLNPYLDGLAKAIWQQEQGSKSNWKPQRPKPKKKPVQKLKRAFIPFEVFNRTRAGYEQNTFIQNLLTRVTFPFDTQDIENVISMYHLGTVQNGYRKGANTFPFIDKDKNIRAVQVKQFDEYNHTTGTDFLHSIIEKHHTRNNKQLPEWLETYNKNETKVSCLFGEHLLNKYPYNPVALVEAPKTAIYGTLYFGFPENSKSLLWLAVYNLSSLNLNKCKALAGRNVYLFPDLSKDGKAFDLWSRKAKDIQKQLQGTYFQVSDLLEQLAPLQDKEQGKDIADYLIQQDWRLFRQQDIKEKPEAEPVEQTQTENTEALTLGNYEKNWESLQPDKVEVFQPDKWENDIAELENFFAKIDTPAQPMKLNGYSTINDCSLFIKSHLATVKRNSGKRTFLPYLNRLHELKQVLNIS